MNVTAPASILPMALLRLATYRANLRPHKWALAAQLAFLIATVSDPVFAGLDDRPRSVAVARLDHSPRRQMVARFDHSPRSGMIGTV